MCIIKFYFQTGFKQSPQSVKMIYIIPLGTDLHLEEPVGLQMGECEICGMKIALDFKKSHMDEHIEEERYDISLQKNFGKVTKNFPF